MELFHDLKLETFEPSEISTELCVKNYLLFTKIEDEVCGVVCERYLVEASNFYTKLQIEYPLRMLDEDSFDRLFNRFLELRTDKTMESMQEDSQDAQDDDISLNDFCEPPRIF